MRSANADMLTLAMAYRGMTQTELASEMGTSQSYVSKLIKGYIPIPEDRIEAIADALGFPAEFFYAEPDLRGSSVPCLYHRKRQTMPLGQLKTIQAEARVAAMSAAAILEDIEIETRFSFPRLDLEDFDSPEEVAQRVRGHWRITRGPIRNLMRVIETAGGVVLKRAFGTRKVDAISQWAPDGKPFFIVNSDVPTDRLRFTLAHEIGHLIMHTLVTPDPEREADRFAAEFLMPAQDIAADLRTEQLTLQRFAQLKSYWRTSMAALIMRAHTLGAISKRQYERLFQLLRMRYGVTEPNPLSAEEPSVLADALKVHREVHHFAPAELASACKISEPDFRDLFGQSRFRLVTT